MVPKYTKEEEKLIYIAKRKVMNTYVLTEREAHRLMQRASMNSRLPLLEIAKAVLERDKI